MPLEVVGRRSTIFDQFYFDYMRFWLWRDVAASNSCINNLRQIDGAKEQWAMENKKSSGTPVIDSEIDQYITVGRPKCPEGGTFQYNPIDENPTCSIRSHTF